MGNYFALAILSILFSAVTLPPSRHVPQEQMRHQSAVAPGWSELSTSIQKMHQAMKTLQSSGNSDLDFVKLMLPHHLAAIEMAKTQLLFGKDPEMRRLAQEIITDQQSEIEFMQLWLKRHTSGDKEH